MLESVWYAVTFTFVTSQDVAGDPLRGRKTVAVQAYSAADAMTQWALHWPIQEPDWVEPIDAPSDITSEHWRVGASIHE